MDKDLLNGMVSGVFQTFAGHPFDTLKIINQCKIQNYSGKKLNGISFNLASSVICNGIIFGSEQKTNKLIMKHKYSEKWISLFLPGFISGILVTPFVFFFDLGKNKRQIFNRKLVASDFIQTNGFGMTLLREPIAFSIYFSTYNYLKKERQLSYFWSGGFAGINSWALTYPLDVIRNRQISFDISVKKAISQKRFYSGLPICLIRAFFVNSTGFFFYEKSKSFFKN